MMFSTLRLATWLVLGSVIGSTVAAAGSLDIRPTLITLSKDHPTTVITVGNSEQKPLTYQARVYRWTQHGTQDSLEPTSDLIISPPMIPIAPGEHRVLRLGLRGAPPQSGEVTYRLVLDELPAAAAQTPGTLAVLLRVLLPVFVRTNADDPGSPQVTGSVRVLGRTARVTLSNSGSGSARLIREKLRIGGVESTVNELRYLLPNGGCDLTFTLPQPVSAPSAALTIESSSGNSSLALQVHP